MTCLIATSHTDSLPTDPVPIPDPIPRPQPMPDPPPDEEPIKLSHHGHRAYAPAECEFLPRD